jgi:hypothetical protein
MIDTSVYQALPTKLAPSLLTMSCPNNDGYSGLSGFHYETLVACFMLPKGVAGIE